MFVVTFKMKKKSKQLNWSRTWWGILVIIFFLPVFIVWYVWAKTKWTENIKIIASTGVVIAYIIILAVASSSSSATITTSSKTALPSTISTSKTATSSAQKPAVSTATPPQSQTIQPVAPFPSISKTTGCKENNGLPDLSCTPGATNSAVTQDTIKQTICVSGYTATIRPSTSYTNNLKTQQIIAYGYSDTSMSDYEEDHFIPLEIGGSADSAANLWPEPYNITYGAKAKDKVENYLHAQICNGGLTLADAQKEMQANWETVYNAHYGTISGDSSTDSDDNVAAPATTPSTSSSSGTTTPAPAATSTPAPTTTNNGGYPAGTTGVCNDGSYTKAVNHQGACSHHKGVAKWVN
jgi:hypothetical protein